MLHTRCIAKARVSCYKHGGHCLAHPKTMPKAFPPSQNNAKGSSAHHKPCLLVHATTLTLTSSRTHCPTRSLQILVHATAHRLPTPRLLNGAASNSVTCVMRVSCLCRPPCHPLMLSSCKLVADPIEEAVNERRGTAYHHRNHKNKHTLYLSCVNQRT